MNLWQLLGLDVESVITQGMLSLSHKQTLIDDALNHSYQIALAAGRFGHCLVCKLIFSLLLSVMLTHFNFFFYVSLLKKKNGEIEFELLILPTNL